MDATFFETPAAFRDWLEACHNSIQELWLGYYKKGSGRPSITWPESVDEALCFGWIDGLRKTIDDASYRIRFTPRKPRSNWSAVNIQRVAELTAQGRMHPAGLPYLHSSLRRRPESTPTSSGTRPSLMRHMSNSFGPPKRPGPSFRPSRRGIVGQRSGG